MSSGQDLIVRLYASADWTLSATSASPRSHLSMRVLSVHSAMICSCLSICFGKLLTSPTCGRFVRRMSANDFSLRKCMALPWALFITYLG
jgi:hypothetical protein